MKISELLKVVDEGWVRKPKGFRVRFQTRKDGAWVTDSLPGENESLLDSDVVAWRSAWKLLQAANSGTGEYVNITVVDDRGEPVRCYATGDFDVYHPLQGALEAPVVEPDAATKPDKKRDAVDEQPGSSKEEETDAQPSSELSDR
jgi:hypothetical protein